MSRFLLAPAKWGFANIQFSALVEAELRHRYILSWGKHWLFLSLYEGRKSRMVSYENDFIETQSTERRSKKSRAVEQPLPSMNSKAPSRSNKFSLRNIWSRKANERHPPPHIHTATLLQRNSWVFLSPWWEGGGKKDPSGNVSRNIALSPVTSLAELSPRACKISGMPIAAPSCSKAFQKSLWAPSENNHCKTRLVFFFFFWDDSFPHTAFIKYIKIK